MSSPSGKPPSRGALGAMAACCTAILEELAGGADGPAAFARALVAAAGAEATLPIASRAELFSACA